MKWALVIRPTVPPQRSGPEGLLSSGPGTLGDGSRRLRFLQPQTMHFLRLLHGQTQISLL